MGFLDRFRKRDDSGALPVAPTVTPAQPDTPPEPDLYTVLQSESGFSFWPAHREIPIGWTRVEFNGTRAECLQRAGELLRDWEAEEKRRMGLSMEPRQSETDRQGENASPDAAREAPSPMQAGDITRLAESRNWDFRNYFVTYIPGKSDDGSPGEYSALIRTTKGQFAEFRATLEHEPIGVFGKYDLKWTYYAQFDDGKTGRQVAKHTDTTPRNTFEKLLDEIVPQIS